PLPIQSQPLFMAGLRAAQGSADCRAKLRNDRMRGRFNGVQHAGYIHQDSFPQRRIVRRLSRDAIDK
ncbi:MAG TPA: hypothetical protein VFX37_15810, partial [Pseudolabrys sp.]|nr:hypothetical protein [Pseudolabrys sp.]